MFSKFSWLTISAIGTALYPVINEAAIFLD